MITSTRTRTRITTRSAWNSGSSTRTTGWPSGTADTSRQGAVRSERPGLARCREDGFIERTAADLGQRVRLGVIVGDLATENDAVRLRAHGPPAIQITTGSVCHLDAEMVSRRWSGWT